MRKVLASTFRCQQLHLKPGPFLPPRNTTPINCPALQTCLVDWGRVRTQEAAALLLAAGLALADGHLANATAAALVAESCQVSAASGTGRYRSAASHSGVAGAEQ